MEALTGAGKAAPAKAWKQAAVQTPSQQRLQQARERLPAYRQRRELLASIATSQVPGACL